MLYCNVNVFVYTIYYNNNNNNNNNIIIALKVAIRDFFYNLLTVRRTVSNTHAQVARALSCANHVQHVVLYATWYEGTAQLLRLTEFTGVLTVFAHHRFANQSDGGRIIPSSLFACLANQYFGINEQSVTNKSFRNTRLSGRLHYEP